MFAHKSAATYEDSTGTPTGSVSINQEMLLLSEEWARRSGVSRATSRLPVVVGLTGSLNVDVLVLALDEIVRRHEVLRSSFLPSGVIDRGERDKLLKAFSHSGLCPPGLYRQSVSCDATIELVTTSLETSALSPQPSAMRQEFEEAALAPLDCGLAPLGRATLFRLAPREHVLLILLSRVVADACSTLILLNELSLAYSARLGGDTRPSPRLGCQYGDFARWQREQITGGKWAASISYWRQQWTSVRSDQLRYSDFECALPRPMAPRFIRGSADIAFDAEMSSLIRSCAAACDATASVVCLSAISLMLQRITKRDRVTIWIDCPNRSNGEGMSTIGWFDNFHLLIISLAGRPSGLELVGRVSTAMRDALTHEQVPLQAVWRGMGECLDSSDLRVTYGRRALARPRLIGGGLTVQRRSLRVGRQLGVDLVLIEDNECVSIGASYSRERFVPVAMMQMLDYVSIFVKAIVLAPGACVSTY